MLKGKKVLLIATAFFGYEIAMKESLERLGADVLYFNERSITTSWEKAIIKITPALLKKKTQKYYNEIIDKCKNKSFDYVYIYGATMIDEKIMKMIKRNIKTDTIIAYLADSVKNSSRYETLFPYFDKIATFDRNDYTYYKEKYPQFCFLPLFYTPAYINLESHCTDDYKYDISFVGTIHSDRLHFLEKIKEQAENLGLRVFYYCYLPGKFMYYYYYITKVEFRKKKKTDFEYRKMTADEIREIMRSSKCVLDAQYPKNIGLTMRTFETLGMKRKLITTNQDIKNYDFYNDENVLIVDRDTPILSNDFFRKDYKILPRNIYDEYHIDNWTCKLFQFTGAGAKSETY